jgi:hypothetical protein
MDRREFLARTGQLAAGAVGCSTGLSAARILGQEQNAVRRAASGPLRVTSKNPRYFCDATGREVLLVGAHTWNNLVDGSVLGNRFDPQWEPIRRNLGHARRLADRLDLTAMSPHDDLASTTFCLADPGNTYVVYIPAGGKATVALQGTPARFAVEWINASTGRAIAGQGITGGADRELAAPFSGDAVLYLSRA